MTLPGDDDAMMRFTRFASDDIVEALIRGDAVPSTHAPLATFAQEVRALGDEPVPTPSDQLAALLEGRPLGIARVAGAAGLGLVAKIGLGASLAAAGVVGAGVAGILPAAANHAVRGAIEVVTPVQFDQDEERPANFGDRVSTDATGESDGEHGVDGQQISEEAPGAAHRGTNAAPDEPPGQTGETGETRADQTPAVTAPGQPDADDEEEQPGSAEGEHGPPESTPSTVPAPRAGS